MKTTKPELPPMDQRLTLGGVEEFPDGGKLDGVPRMPGAKAQTGASAGDGLAEAQGDRRDAVLGSSRSQRVDVVGTCDAGHVGIETRAVPLAGELLQHHRHPFLLEPV